LNYFLENTFAFNFGAKIGWRSKNGNDLGQFDDFFEIFIYFEVLRFTANTGIGI
jgi:hypothetical protein